MGRAADELLSLTDIYIMGERELGNSTKYRVVGAAAGLSRSVRSARDSLAKLSQCDVDLKVSRNLQRAISSFSRPSLHRHALHLRK